MERDFLTEINAVGKGGLAGLEGELYQYLKQNEHTYPTNALIALMIVEIALNQNQKAKAIADRVWEVGQKPENPLHEKLYVNALMDIGLLEMTSAIIKPRFENLVENMTTFKDVFMKFAIMAGSVNLMEKIAVQTDNEAISDFVEVYQNLQYEQHFKNIQMISLNEIKEVLCGYEYNIYTDRGFTDVEVIFHVVIGKEDAAQKKADIDNKIKSYCQRQNTEKLNNLTIKVTPTP